MKSIARQLLIVLVLLIPGALLLTEVLFYGQNSIFLGDQWVAQKSRMRMYTEGAYDFLLTRKALNQNVLDLGTYHGFQEIIAREASRPEEISFSFAVFNNAYLDITFNRDSEGYDGLRLSQFKSFDSMTFRALESGQFTAFRKIPPVLLTEGWHRAILRPGQGGLVLEIDGRKIPVPGAEFKDGRVGFASGLNAVLLDDVEVKSANGVFYSGFANRRQGPQVLLIHWMLLFALGILSGAPLGRKLLFNNRYGQFHWITFSLFVAVAAGGWLAYDYKVYSLIYPPDSGMHRYIGEKDEERPADFENWRIEIFRRWATFVGAPVVTREARAARNVPGNESIRPPYQCTDTELPCLNNRTPIPPKPKDRPVYRIVYIGSSQTTGIGAARLEDTFFVRVHRMIRAKLDPKISLQSINLAVPGTYSEPQTVAYRAQRELLKADVMVINLANNDGDPGVFHRMVSALIEMNKADGIRTVLIKEANSPKKMPEGAYPENLKTSEALGVRYQIPVVDLNGFLANLVNTFAGKMWWDHVHMGNFGQEKGGGANRPAVEKELRKSKPR